MTPSCLSVEQMRAFLAGRLSADDESSVIRHIESCARCEQLAAELSDDQQTRALAALGRRQDESDDPSRELDDLRLQMRAVASYDSVERAAGGGSSIRVAKSAPTVAYYSRAVLNTAGGPITISGACETDADQETPRLAHLGRYKIVRTLGAGTFGIVYLAEDQRLHRQVALKVARAGVLADPALRIRFFREAEALARLQHPHIVPVYEADEIDGLCFLAVAYCEGPTLYEFLRDRGRPLEPLAAARLALPLAEAVACAHAHGILHRDIKPGNVLLSKVQTPQSTAGAGSTAIGPWTLDRGRCTPLIADFGLAKLVEENSPTTVSGLVLGTPQYMAPEQASGCSDQISTATDVYALGAVIYEMLTGRAPIEGRSTVDTLRRVLLDHPAEIHTISPAVPEDLCAIVMKCLEKAPGRRYATAAKLADDLRRFLDGRPTLARPLTRIQRAGRWMRRNPMLAALVFLAATVAGLSAGLFYYAYRLSATEGLAAREAAKSAQLAHHLQSTALLIAQRDYGSDIRLAASEAFRGNLAQAAALLRKQAPLPSRPDLRGLEWFYLCDYIFRRPAAQSSAAGGDVYCLRLSPDRHELAAVGKDGLLRLYDAENLALLAAWPTGQGEVNSVAYSADGRLAATTGDDGTVRIWDLASREERLTIAAHPDKTFGAVFFDDANKLATCGNEPVIRLWDAQTGKSLGQLVGHDESVEALAVSPDGKRLASASSDDTAIIWDLATGSPLYGLSGHQSQLTSVCFSPDGRWLATGSLDARACLWDWATGRQLCEQYHLDQVQSVEFSRDGSRLYVGDRSGKVHDYLIVHRPSPDDRTRLVLHSFDDTWLAHDSRIWSIAAGAGEDRFYTAGRDGWIRRWQFDEQDRLHRTISAAPADAFADVEFSPDGNSLLVLRQLSGISVLDVGSLQPRRVLASRHYDWRTLAVLEGRDEVAAGNANGLVAIWNWKTGELRQILSRAGDTSKVSKLAYAPRTGVLAVLQYAADDVALYDAASGRRLALLPAGNPTTVAFSPDGRQLAIDSLNEIWIYDVATQRRVATLAGHSSTVRALDYSLNGRLLASGSSDRTVRLWSVEGQSLGVLPGHQAPVGQVRFSADGKTLVTIDDAGTLKLVQVDTFRSVFDIPTHTASLRGLALAPDSRRLAVIRAEDDILLIGRPPAP